MAWYPPEFVERVRLIKQLQEERFLPLKVIREVIEQGEDEGGSERLRALIELEDRVLERALSGQDAKGLSARERWRSGTASRRTRSTAWRSSRCSPRVPATAPSATAPPTCRSSRRSAVCARRLLEALGFTVYDT